MEDEIGASASASNRLGERELIRKGYLERRLIEFRAAWRAEKGSDPYIIPRAAGVVARKTFDLEDRHIRPHVNHAPGHEALLCRHKIIAATQCAIMATAPLRRDRSELGARSRESGLWSPATREINTNFASAVSIHMLDCWMQHYQLPAQARDSLVDADLAQTYGENKVWLYDSLLVGLGNDEPRFPFALFSQLWSMIDRYATLKGGGVFPPGMGKPAGMA